MADTGQEQTVPEKRAPRRRMAVLRVVGWVLVGLLGLIILAGVGLQTAPGRAVLVKAIESLRPESGLRIDIGRIDGSPLGRMMIHDLRLADPKGTFLHVPSVLVDWRPTHLAENRLVVYMLHAHSFTLSRLPELIDTPDDPDKPLFPEIDISLDSFAVEEGIIGEAVTGQRHVLIMSASGLLEDGRLRARGLVDARSGDRLTLEIDVEPERDRLDVNVQLDAPPQGLVAELAGLKVPFNLTVDGQGQWSRWDGTARARVGTHPLLNLNIAGRSGRFTLSGQAAPAPLLGGMPARLLAGTSQLAATVAFDKPRIGFDVKLNAPAISLSAAGGLDTETSRWQAVTAVARLLKPAVLLDGMNGENIAMSLAVDGPMAMPNFGYKLTADMLGFEATRFHGVLAEGRATVEGEQWSIPVRWRAASVTGVDEAMGGLLRGLRVDGVVHLTDKQLLADNLAVRSDRLTGKAVVAVTFATGDYNVALEGQTNRYAVPGLGMFDLRVNAGLKPQPGTGELLLSARVQARGVRIDNETLRDLLGGMPAITANIERHPNGTLVVRNAQVRAPGLQMTIPRGSYNPDGRVALEGRGQSRAYGPFTVAVSGQAKQPRVHLTLARPDLGLGLSNVTVDVTPGVEGYRIAAKGSSPHGPFTALARLGQERGATVVDVEQLRLAGLNLAGRVRQTAAGPFAGVLRLGGAGLNGQLMLAAEGAVQRIDANLRATQSRPLAAMPLYIGQGNLEAVIRLPEAGPSINADMTLKGVRYADWRVNEATGSARYQGGRGDATLAVRGRGGAPFDLSIRSAFQPKEIRVTMAGTVARRQVLVAKPAVLTRTAAGWQLAPTTLQVDRGRLDLEGHTGPQATALARLTNMDLSILDLISPEFGLSGAASGTVRASGLGAGRMPLVDTSLVIRRLRRSSLAAQSEPVDLGINARLSEQQGAVRLVVRHKGAIVGRVQALLTPSQPAVGDWRSRLAGAALRGGVRYTGPAELLWALSGQAGHELVGPITISADAVGTVAHPIISGSVNADRLAYENEDFGTRIRDIALQGHFQGSRFELRRLSGTTPGGGRVSGQGYIDLSAAKSYPMDIRTTFSRAQVARMDNLTAAVSGPLTITHGPQGGRIQGRLNITEARYRIGREEVAEVPRLEVRRVGDEAVEATNGAKAAPPATAAFALDIQLRADNRVFVEGLGLESEWETDLAIGGTLAAPRLVGSVQVVRGTYAFAGRRFELTRGIIRFAGDYPPSPSLDIAASASIDGVIASLTIGGTAQTPQIGFASTPALPQDEILSRLLFGNSITELSATEALQLGAAVASLRGGGGGKGFNPLGKIRRATDIDRLRILGADERTGRGTSLAVGKYLGDDVYVEVITDAQGNTLTQLEIQLSRAFSILSQVGRVGTSSLQLQYAKDY